MTSSSLMVASLAVTLVAQVTAWPTGAPKEACATMVPKHGPDPQNSPAPYELTYEKTGEGVYEV